MNSPKNGVTEGGIQSNRRKPQKQSGWPRAQGSWYESILKREAETRPGSTLGPVKDFAICFEKEKKKKNLEPGRAKFRQGSRVIKLLKKTTLSRYTCRKQITSNGNKCIKGEAISVIQEKDAAAWIQMLAVDKGGCV